MLGGFGNDPLETAWDESWQFDNSGNNGGTQITSTGIRIVPKFGRFLRLRWSIAQTSGTTRVTLVPISDSSKRNVAVVNNVQVQGTTTHGSAISGNPVRIAARARDTTNVAISADQTADLQATLNGALTVKPYGPAGSDWQYAAAAGGIVNTTDVVARAAGAAGVRNYVTGVQLRNANAVATEFVVKEGATVIWRTQLPANMTGSMNVEFTTPLRGAAATAINVACITTGAQVYCNVQGFQAA